MGAGWDKDRDDRDRPRHRHLDHDRGRERKDRNKRSHTPDQSCSHHTRSRTRSPDHRRSRSRSTDRHRRKSHHCTPSPDHSRKRRRHDNKRTAAVVSDFVDEIVKEKQQKSKKDKEVEVSEGGEMDADEIHMMKMMGIPVGFDSTKGKPVEWNDVSGVRVVTKRQPRQYMNRRGGFNRPLPAEVNL
ncbi:putative U4/U6.U5 small nuclear ribonucleoprotein 27kDa protein [Helianthus annuus]|nr:putative U4/U6.U5 small nuclear ribonucleoprotein 27kDa protein [Helianthus annuus]